MSDISELPCDVLVNVFSFLDIRSLAAASLVCRYACSLACFYEHVNWFIWVVNDQLLSACCEETTYLGRFCFCLKVVLVV
jgi:F-box-like